MLKCGSILKSRGYISRQLLNRNETTQNVNGLHSLMSSVGISTAGQNIFANDQIYAQYSVYKGKAALSASPVRPTFAKLNTGIAVKRQGVIMLSFTPSVGERKYDWERKQYFALSTTEVGSLINLDPTGSCEFYHDPSMKTSNAGEVRKSLSIKALADGAGYFFSLTVANNATKTNERITVPVTSAEFAVMRTSFSFALPHIMGWDRFSSQQPRLEENIGNAGQKQQYNSGNTGQRQQFNSGNTGQRQQLNSGNAGPRQLNSEWDR